MFQISVLTQFNSLFMKTKIKLIQSQIESEFTYIFFLQVKPKYILIQVRMIEFFFLSIPANITYERLKKPLLFSQKLQDYACWAFKQPLVIYSNDLKQKHIFSNGRVEVEKTLAPNLEQKWRYFVMTRSNNQKVYCTSYIFYQKCPVLCQSSSFFNISGQTFNYLQFHLPKCLIITSQKPYFKLETNLIKIHRELRRNNPSIDLPLNKESLEACLDEQNNKGNSFKLNSRRSLLTSVTSYQSSKQIKKKGNRSFVDTLFNYYVSLCNETPVEQKMYVSSETKLQILHMYSLSDSLYRFNYFFHMPLSTSNLMIVFAAILQQKQIIFTSNNQNSNLMLMQTLLQMLTPLKWQFMYVPNLPESMLEAAQESFMPYMVGIHKKYLQRITTKSRVVVHVDSDHVQFEQPLLQLPESLKNMFASLEKTHENSPYLEWQKEMRIRSILLISTLLTQFPCLQNKQTQCPNYLFYSYFFQSSTIYNTFREQLNKPANIEICQLLWMPLAMKIKTIQMKFQHLLFEVMKPRFYENEKEWIKYYYNNIQKRRSLKNASSSQFVFSNNSIPTMASSSMIMSSHSEMKERRDGETLISLRKSLMPKRGIGFINSTKN